MRKHTITILFLCLALGLYAVGAAVPATILIFLGGIAELAFWLRIFSAKKRGGSN